MKLLNVCHSFVVVTISMFYGVCSLYAGPALDSLNAASRENSSDLDMIYDGASSGLCPAFQPEVSLMVNSQGSKQPVEMIQGESLPVSLPLPVPSLRTNVNGGLVDKEEISATPLNEYENQMVEKAKRVFYKASVASDIPNILAYDGVSIQWAELGNFNRGEDYASACSPRNCGNKHIIYLNRRYRDLFMSTNPTFLAVTLAHEAIHESDYKFLGEISPGSAFLYFELRGWSIGVYVYHTLLRAGIAPRMNSAEESVDIQLVRLDLAIREYMNGGEKPKSEDFSKINPQALGGRTFEKYISNVTEQKHIGSMSLAGIVEDTYVLKPDLETPVEPSLYDLAARKGYSQYVSLREWLGARTAEYIKWRDNVHDGVDNESGVNSGQPGNAGGGSSSTGGINAGGNNHVGHDVDWHDGSKGPWMQ